MDAATDAAAADATADAAAVVVDAPTEGNSLF